MSILGVLLVIALAAFLGLTVALAFARAVLYASVLTELDGAHDVSRRFGPRSLVSRPAPRPRP